MVTSRTVPGRRDFSDWRTGRLLVNEFKRAHEQGLIDSLAWVVMPDHFHWLFELRSHSLTRVIQQVKSRSGIAVNKAWAADGRLWQTGFHDLALRREQSLRQCAQYIVANPLRAGLVKRLGDYPLWDAVWLNA